jgi:hypothetical protein
MSYSGWLGICGGLWLLSVMACCFAFRWSYLGMRRRFVASVLLSLTALVIGYVGLTRFHFAASKTVNGHVQWRFNSRWLFLATLILAGGTLAYTIWKRLQTMPSQPTKHGTKVS